MSEFLDSAVKQAIVTLGFVSCITAALDASVSPSSLGSEKRTLILSIERTRAIVYHRQRARPAVVPRQTPRSW